jgi:DNA-binding CsgD family transcriptional regulator
MTERELEAFRLLARDLSNAEIGRELYISDTTVKTHTTHILMKLSLRDRVQAVVLAFTLCALVIYKRRRPGLWETWVWRVTLTGYVLVCAGVFLEYWTQWTGNYNVLFEVGWIVIVPALFLTMVGSTVLGITLLVRGSSRRLPAVLLALVIPLAWLILLATSLGNAVLPGDVRVRDPRASARLRICRGGESHGYRGFGALSRGPSHSRCALQGGRGKGPGEGR